MNGFNLDIVEKYKQRLGTNARSKWLWLPGHALGEAVTLSGKWRLPSLREGTGARVASLPSYHALAEVLLVRDLLPQLPKASSLLLLSVTSILK